MLLLAAPVNFLYVRLGFPSKLQAKPVACASVLCTRGGARIVVSRSPRVREGTLPLFFLRRRRRASLLREGTLLPLLLAHWRSDRSTPPCGSCLYLGEFPSELFCRFVAVPPWCCALAERSVHATLAALAYDVGHFPCRAPWPMRLPYISFAYTDAPSLGCRLTLVKCPASALSPIEEPHTIKALDACFHTSTHIPTLLLARVARSPVLTGPLVFASPALASFSFLN